MNEEIKRLLKLESIPNFQLTADEIQTLKNWKKEQQKIVVTKPKKIKAPKGYKTDEGLGNGDTPSIVPANDSQQAAEERKTIIDPINEVKSVKNVVKDSDKELGKIEES